MIVRIGVSIIGFLLILYSLENGSFLGFIAGIWIMWMGIKIL
jgi:hypothetical protein